MDWSDRRFKDKTFIELARLVAEEDLQYYWQALLIIDMDPGSPEYEYYYNLLVEWFGPEE